MSHELPSSLISCPYCGESLNILIDDTAGSQSYIEDCQVCCSPIEISLEIGPDGSLENIVAKRDSD